MLAALDDSVLKLHVGMTGDVWFADGRFAPRNSGYKVATFMDHPAVNQHRAVRILGTPQNTLLICRLFERALSGTIRRLELAGPRVCETAAERQDPEIALFRMRQCLLHPSLGGWHVMTTADYPSYAILSALQDPEARPEYLIHLLRIHPAWPYVSFIRGLEPQACARVISAILDPRWFICPYRPDRVGRLESFLGLSPRIQRSLADPNSTVKAHASRYLSVVAAWGASSPPSEAELRIPENFLWRDWAHAGRGERGYLRASQRFIAYLRHAWLEGLATTAAGRRVELFDPLQIFKTQDEIAAYAEHMERQRNEV